LLISKEIIKEIKDRSDIVAIIRDYVHSLKKTGKNWTGLCPFHNEKHPSFSVSEEYGIYRCFSCGETGDIFKFIEKIEGLDFSEAATFLAKKCGVDLKFDNNNDNSFKRKDELINFNERIIKLFQHFLLKLNEGRNAMSYLIQRNIDNDIINIFKIGYAPREYGRLENILKKKGFNDDFLIESGLFSKGDRGLKPLFFDRVIFPIFNYRNECIGFGGRALNNEIKPKYINSPETMLYKKSYNLYGISLAKEHIQKSKKVYIVEGYVDVISCYKNGLKNVVAPCGTAITSGQIKLLSRYAEEIVLLLDGDEAGLKGIGKALNETVNIENIKTTVVVLPDGMDPDDYFKNHDLMDFIEYEKKSLNGFDFLVYYKSRNLDKKDYKSLTDVLRFLFEYINLWKSEIIQNTFIDRLSGLLNIDRGIVSREFESFKKQNNTGSKETPDEIIKIRSLDEMTKREVDLILLLSSLKDCKELIKQCDFKYNYLYNEKLKLIFNNFLDSELSESRKFIDLIDDDVIKNYINQRIFSDELKQNESVLKNNIIDLITYFTRRYYKKELEVLTEKIKLAELYKDEELVKELQEEKHVKAGELSYKINIFQELKIG
jgi:DNA primase